MPLFAKKNEEEKKPVCACQGACPVPGAAQEASTGRGPEDTGIRCLKVLGTGCKSCHTQYEQAKRAVQAMGLDAEVQYITDLEQVMAYGVLRMPALVVNERVISSGKVRNAAAVEDLLHGLGF